MKKLAILGLGHIGKYVLDILNKDKNFARVQGFDLTTGHDLSDENLLDQIVSEVDGVLASTPFFLNKKIASVCHKNNKDYFDLTESVEVTEYVKNLSGQENSNSRFVTQCGLAPGMVSMIANFMALKFDQVKNIEIRVGALPQNASNSLGYYRTWNTEGLINEYINPCPAVKNYKLTELEPLADQENITLNGAVLEAANTSGGLGSLAVSWENKAENVNYKTLRYPGHWDLIRFLASDLGLKKNFDTYVKLFNENVPVSSQDYVFILITVTGMKNNIYTVDHYSNIIEGSAKETAIQLTTGSGVLTVLDIWNQGKIENQQGWIKQEQLDFSGIWNSQYAKCYHI